MRLDLLGLELSAAQERLLSEGICPRVTVTSAPKRAEETGGLLRIVFASDDGTQLIAARFLDPIAGQTSEADRE